MSNWPRWVRRASSRSSSVSIARVARSDRRWVRSRARAICWRCACALADREVFSRAARLSKRSRRRCKQRARRMRQPLAAIAKPIARMASPGRAVPAKSAARWRRQSGGNARACWRARHRGRAPPAASSRCRGIASSSLAAGSARAAARNSLRRPSMPRCQQTRLRRARLSISASRSLRTGTAISAAAVGVGRALVGGEIDQRDVGLMADRRDQRDHAVGRSPHHDLLVERPEILQRPAAAGDDQKIRTRDAAAFGQRVEATDGGGHLFGRAVALHLDRPDQHAARKTILQPVQDVADHGTGGRGDDADHFRQPRQLLLAPGVEQALGGELLLALLQEAPSARRRRPAPAVRSRSGTSRSRGRW